ncbi:MAG TPA: DUF2769 domain-containing protein [Methanocella sp.]|nr:DUF2769 domain-containing protein [Methanocella sp.]
MLGLSDEDKKWMDSECRCAECPTRPSGDSKAVYCYNDRSKLKPNPVTCICPTCDVYRKKDFTGTNYFCISGRPLTKIAGAEMHKAVGGGK